MIADTSGPCIVVFTGDSAFLYSVIKCTVNVTHVWVKMFYHCYKFCFSSHNLVVSGSYVSWYQVSGSRVTDPWVLGLTFSGLRSQGPGSRIPGLESQVPGPGSQVLIFNYAKI